MLALPLSIIIYISIVITDTDKVIQFVKHIYKGVIRVDLDVQN